MDLPRRRRVPSPLVVLAVLALSGSAAATPGCRQTNVADGFAGELTTTAGGFDPIMASTAEECATFCGLLSTDFSAVETMGDDSLEMACLCAASAEGQQLDGTAETSGCTSCEGGTCGGLDGHVWLGPATEDISQLTLTLDSAVPTRTGQGISLTAVTDTSNVDFEMSIGDGSPPVTVAGTNDPVTGMGYMVASPAYWVPGSYVIVVTATKRGGRAVEAASVNVTVEAAGDLLEVTCPPVVEPFTTYYCGAALSGSGVQASVTYSDEDSPRVLEAPDSAWPQAGLPPPQGMSNTTTLRQGADTFILSTPFSTVTRLTQIRAFGASKGECTITVVTPVCTSPDVFCPAAGVCTSSCALMPENQAQCSAGTFCPLSGMCVSGDIATGDCGLSSAPVSFATGDTFPFPVTQDKHVATAIDAEVVAQPGDLVQVTCPGANIAATEAVGVGDLDETSSRLQLSHMVQVIGAEVTPITVSHQCTRPVTTVSFTAVLADGEPLANETKCEYIIRNLTVWVLQAGRMMNGSAYLDTSLPATVMLQMADGAPANMTWDYGESGLPPSNQVLLERVSPTEYYNQTVTFPAAGTFVVNGSATNSHSEELGATWGTLEVVLQNPVLPDWALEVASPSILVVPTANPPVEVMVDFHIKLPSSLLLPTDAYIFADFGDQYPMAGFEPLAEHGIGETTQPVDEFYVIELRHPYADAGLYDVVVEMKNEISHVNLTTTVEVEEKIVDFQVQMKFQLVETTEELEDGLGDAMNEFHNDKNITFVMSMTQGTVTEYKLYNTSYDETELLATFPVDDKYKPTEGNFFYYFSENQNLNLTFTAGNDYEVSERVETTIWIKDPITEIEGVSIVEGPDVTSRGMEKPINITFMAASLMKMCMVVDYGDGAPLAAYGDKEECDKNYSKAAYQPNDLTTPMQLQHTYWADGAYNLSVVIFNPVSVSKSDLTFLVTNFPCPKPVVSVEGAALLKETANEYFRAAKITISTETALACDVLFTSIKRWQVLEIDEMTGETLDEVQIENILPSWNKSSLFFKSKFLDFGLYKLLYSLTMWEEGTEKPELPYQVVSTFYIKVIRSPLIAIMVKGSVSRVVRGWGQKLFLDPRVNSIDPDMPEDKSFEFEWHCRLLTENFTMNGTELVDEPKQRVPTPGDPAPSTSAGGCFGLGPGPIDYSNGTWEIDTSVLHPRGAPITFELLVVIRKNGRMAQAFLHLEMVSGKPPMMSIVCADSLLCYPTDGGVFVNPKVRLGLRGECLDDCFPPLTYRWKVSKVENGEPVPIDGVEDYIMSAPGTKELGLSADLFGNYSTVEKFHVSLTSNNTHPSQKTGSSTFYVIINKPPVVKDSNCRTVTTGNYALLHKMIISCQKPSDPENHPIKKFEFRTKTVSPTTGKERWKTVATVKKPEISLRMPYGAVTVYYDASDILGGTTTKEVTTISTLMPTQDEYNEIMMGPVFKEASDSGNVKDLAMIMQASETIRESAYWLSPDYNPPGSEGLSNAELISMQNNAAMSGLLNMPFDGKGSLDVGASTLESTLGTSMGSPENSLQVDSATLSASLQVVGAMVDSLDDSDIASPEGLVTAFKGINSVVGVATVNSATIAADEECNAVPVFDLKKAGTLDYDGLIGDYGEKTVIPDEAKQLACNVKTQSMVSFGETSKTFDTTVETMQKTALKKQVLGEELVIDSPSGMVLKTKMMENMTGTMLGIGDAGGGVETGSNFCPTGNCDEPVALAMTDYPTNAKSSAEGASRLSKDARVIAMEVKSRELSNVEVSNLTEPLRITLPKAVKNMSNDANCTECQPGPTAINTQTALQKKLVPLIYSQFSIPKPDSAFNIEIYPVTTALHRLFVMVGIGRQPTMKQHDFFKMVDDFPVQAPAPDGVEAAGKYDWFISSDVVNNRTGRAFVAVGELKDSLDLELTKQKLDTNETVEGARAKDFLKSNFSTNYLIRTFTSGCYYFKKDWNMWTSDGMRCVGADDRSVTCESTHLTMFGSGFVVEPNTIDFAYVFANASFTDNMTIYMTMIISLVLYFLLVIWARGQDKKDVEKLGARPMPDNSPQDKYLYEIMVFTGHKSSAATDSTVSLILSGDKDETPIRTFGTPNRRFFRKGGQDAFVMACPRPLGDLQYLRIWHDNSGRGRYASWYLQYIHIRDVQTGKHYDFVGDRWLALEEDDGQIDRLIAVAGKEQLGQFSHLFSHTSQKNLSDGHLWFSVFLRPPRSRFTRVQRVSACFALLFLSMMVNAMWYGVVPSTPSAGAINFGPMSLSPEQISVGIMSNLIVFPPSFLIVFLFRNARARTLRKSRIDDALEKQSFGNHVSKSDRRQSTASHASKTNDGGKKKKKKILLPWWCNIIAWVLCVICLFGSAFIVWSYGVQFGNEKTTKWLTSLLMSFFSSILLIQPLKVFLIAMVLSAIFKSVDLDGDDADEDELEPTLASDEEWIYSKPKKKKPDYGKGTDMYDQATLEKMRKGRLNEVQMWRIIREIVSYGFFLWILIILSFDNRDPNSFFMRYNLEAAFIKQGDMTDWKSDLDFSKVHDTGTFWKWCENVLMQELRAQKWYDGVSPPYGLRGFLDDRVNRIMGYGMIRQIRAKPDTCRIHDSFKPMFDHCSAFSSIVNEEDGHFCANWTTSGSAKDCSRPEYRYMSAGDLDGLPYIGSQDIYGGGGYVFKLTGRQTSIAKNMQVLRDEQWIDHLTRAVLVEFSVYNSQVNLFGIATIFVEAVPGGGLLPNWRFDGVRLIRHQAGFQLFVFICEVTYLLFIIYFMVREIRDIVKLKKAYFKSYWVYAEWWIILISWAGLVVYIMRFIETNSILETFKKTYGNGYVKMQYAQSLDDLFGYLIGLLVFVATIKFSKLLRFNRRIGMLSATLKQCWGDLTGFFCIFFIALGTFAMVFNLLLVTTMDDFKDIVSAVESSFAMLLNKFDFHAMYRTSVFAVVLFLCFAITMTIFFVNVLLTIIIRAFQQVKDDVLSQPNDFEIVEFISARLLRFVGLGQRRIVPLRVQMKEYQEEQRRQQNQQSTIDQLPDKMDQFLKQVNDIYFDGQLHLNNKEFLMKTLQQQQDRERYQQYGGEQATKKKPRADASDRSNMNQYQMELDDV